MFNFLRNLTKSAEEKRQETVAAYLDGALSSRERQRFEQAMAQDNALRTQVEQLRLIKQSLRQLPQRQVPRNFVLNPAAYGRPAAQPWVQAYPVLRTATAMAAFFFIFALATSIFTGFGFGYGAASVADVAQSEMVEVTRIVTETVTETEQVESLAFEAEAGVAANDTAETEEVAEEESAVEAEIEIAAETAEATVEREVPPIIEAQPEDNAAAPAPQATAPISSTSLPDRDLEIVTSEEMGDEIAAEEPAQDRGTESAETTPVLPETAVREPPVNQPLNPLLWLQLGLGLLLLLLVGLTFYARKQR